MSEAAKTALINAKSGVQVAPGNAAVFTELHELKLVGSLGGLTRKGSIERERLVNAALDAAF